MGFNSAFKGLIKCLLKYLSRCPSCPGHGLDNRGFESHQKQAIFFSSTKHHDWFCGPSSPLCNGYCGPVSGVKLLGRDVNSPLSCVEIKNNWSRTSTSPMYLYGVDREKLQFYFLNKTSRRHSTLFKHIDTHSPPDYTLS